MKSRTFPSAFSRKAINPNSRVGTSNWTLLAAKTVFDGDVSNPPDEPSLV